MSGEDREQSPEPAQEASAAWTPGGERGRIAVFLALVALGLAGLLLDLWPLLVLYTVFLALMLTLNRRGLRGRALWSGLITILLVWLMWWRFPIH